MSAKIQQLLNTLKRPKRRPLPEFYEDDDIELEIAANPKDPNAPKPEGSSMTSAVGEQLVVCTVYVTFVGTYLYRNWICNQQVTVFEHRNINYTESSVTINEVNILCYICFLYMAFF